MNPVVALIREIEQFKTAFYLGLFEDIGEWEAASFLLDADLALWSLKGITPLEGVERGEAFVERWQAYFGSGVLS